jgi:hypothetical protein
MNKYLHYAAVLLGAGFCVMIVEGCQHEGTRFETGNISRIEKGKTSKKDILQYFGEPPTMESAPLGEVWTYTYVAKDTTAAGVLGHVTIGVDQAETTVEKLTIIFDGDLVKDYDYSHSNHTDTTVPLSK